MSETISEEEYLELLKARGAENITAPQTASESTIAPESVQYKYKKDYFVGDFVTVEHKRFGLKQKKIQLVGMVESFDQNGRNLTPTFKEVQLMAFSFGFFDSKNLDRVYTAENFTEYLSSIH